MIFALKIIKKNEETEIDFLREKQILYDLTKKNYKHVVKLYAHFEDYNNRYLVMEFVDGTTLKVLKGNPPNGYVLKYITEHSLIEGICGNEISKKPPGKDLPGGFQMNISCCRQIC